MYRKRLGIKQYRSVGNGCGFFYIIAMSKENDEMAKSVVNVLARIGGCEAHPKEDKEVMKNKMQVKFV